MNLRGCLSYRENLFDLNLWFIVVCAIESAFLGFYSFSGISYKNLVCLGILSFPFFSDTMPCPLAFINTMFRRKDLKILTT